MKILIKDLKEGMIFIDKYRNLSYIVTIFSNDFNTKVNESSFKNNVNYRVIYITIIGGFKDEFIANSDDSILIYGNFTNL